MADLPVVPGFTCRRKTGARTALVALTLVFAFGQVLFGAPVEGPMLDPGGQPPPAAGPSPGLPAEEPVVEVRIEGNRVVKLEKILAHIHTRAGRPYSSEQIEKDVRELNRMRLFVTVRPLSKQVPGGRLVIFQLVERPVLQEVKVIGNESISTKTLKKEIDLKVGDAADPFAVEEGRRKVEEFYQKKGFSKIRVTVLDGNKPGDLRAIYVVNEGPKQKILWISFVGNTIASSARLTTQIKSRHPYAWIFKGEVDRKLIDEDVERLTAYYRGLGFFRARIGRELEFNDKQNWLTLTFVIDEGPRYAIRNISFVGNTKLSSDQLTAKLKLRNGQFFNQAQMTADTVSVQDQYGGIGYVFADIKAENRFLDEPGQLDLVYNVTEGDRYRVGRINVEIKGENPHTRITTVLNRLSLKPGDLVDTRELRTSERRLKASGLFLVDPSKGAVPKIVYSPPELEDKDKESGMAKRPSHRTSYYRGSETDATGRPVQNPLPPLPPGERYADVVLQYENSNDLRQDEQPPSVERQSPRFRGAPPPDGPVPPMEPPIVVRGQYTGDSGWSTPELRSQPAPIAPSPAPANYQAAQPAAPQAYPSGSAPWPPAAGQVNPAYQAPQGQISAAPPAQGYPAPSYPAQAVPQQAYPAPSYPAQAVPQQGYGPATAAQTAPVNPGFPGAVQPGPPYGNQAMGPAPAVGATPGSAAPNDRLFGDASPYMVPTPDGEPLRDLPLTIRTEETQTGRLMFGVGVNSEAGVVGSIVLDEQNFDWTRVPSSWEDVRNGTAFRGAGQRFRAEAVPGSQVQRYMISFQEPYLMDTAVGLGLSGFYYDRIYDEWRENRLGGRVGLSYQFTHDLTGTVAFRGQNVKMMNPEYPVPDLLAVLGNNQLYGFSAQLAHDTRDNAFLPTEGHMISLSFEQVVGTFKFPHAEIEASQYFKIFERPDGSGRHVLSLSARAGYSGDDTPIFERYFAGGFSTIRGFRFRGVSPRDPTFGMPVGGNFELLTSAQYLFPITADDMLRGVVFVDAGTVEPKINDWSDKFRVAPGFGLRIAIPMMGPAPIALDFAFPVVAQSGDSREVFSFFVGFNR